MQNKSEEKTSKDLVKKKDFIELEFTGYTNGNIFDSNRKEDLAKISPKTEPKKMILAVGEGMVVSGLDKGLEGKEIGKEYEIEVKPKEGFGERRRDFLKTIPMKVFTEKNVTPRAGMLLALDNTVVKIITVSGARVITDFNNPLSGKTLKYNFKIIKKVNDEKIKADALFEVAFRFIPEYEIKDTLVVKGPKILEQIVKSFSMKFKDLIGKELSFEEKEEEKQPEKKEKGNSN
ncbi:FKBP-type peptidyl-prolyl cis-trans isomerase [Candidatus Pacearchaeota archaeon]|nr:FKBP-type peptidyl-prolyl cis-trans isomerase [Candidatus Pacearchaeota archaeon]